eukprot:5460429-Prymnesium_polylepis.1
MSASAGILVHIDFKGLPLTPEYLVSLFETIQRDGATGVILEWEDLLPFSGELAELASANAFSADEVAQVVGKAEALGLEVVPLVQTLGHLEFVLKHERFASLREDKDEYGTLCPCHAGSAKLVETLLAQVLAFHTRSTKVHIGCDEPTLGKHELTAAAAAATADGMSGVLVGHVERTVAAVRALGRTALMWHDAGVGMSPSVVERLFDAGAQLVVWDYRPDIKPGDAAPTFADRILAKADASGVLRPYVATSYKGGDVCDAVLPDEGARVANQRAWKAWAAGDTEAAPARPVAGVVLTG